MRSENGLALDLNEVLVAIAGCDVMVLGFSHLAPRVLFDFRPGSGDPLFRLVPPVRTPQERFAQLRKLRPDLGDPERFLFVQWPLGMTSLLDLGLWDAVVDRCRLVAPERANEDCSGIVEKLRELDRREDFEAIRGDSYRTIWPPSGRQRRQ